MIKSRASVFVRLGSIRTDQWRCSRSRLSLILLSSLKKRHVSLLVFVFKMCPVTSTASMLTGVKEKSKVANRMQ